MTSLAPVDRPSLVATRRDIHQHPELGFEETRTATLIADRLRTFGYEVTPGVGKTGGTAPSIPARCTRAAMMGTSPSAWKSRGGSPRSRWVAA